MIQQGTGLATWLFDLYFLIKSRQQTTGFFLHGDPFSLTLNNLLKFDKELNTEKDQQG